MRPGGFCSADVGGVRGGEKVFDAVGGGCAEVVFADPLLSLLALGNCESRTPEGEGYRGAMEALEGVSSGLLGDDGARYAGACVAHRCPGVLR